MTFKQTLNKLNMGIKKNSPAIFTGLGVVGLGATAYLAYKSKDKVEAVVEEVERKRDLDQPVDKLEVAKGLTEALYQPVMVGAASVTCILLAQRIQNNRIKTLIGVVAVEQARNLYFEKKYEKQNGEGSYSKFMMPTEEVETVELDKKGKEKITVQEVKMDIDKTIGQWYDESSEYVSDDHTYNISYIDSVNERLQTILFQRGSLLLNEVREALGFERIRSGALLGWTSQDSFEIEKVIGMLGNEDLGETREQIWVSWSRPRYIYDEMEFNGRYSAY
jgi:hypothetical protein